MGDNREGNAETNNYFENLRKKLEKDFEMLQKSGTMRPPKKHPKFAKNFTFFSSEKKLSPKETTTISEGSNQKIENQFLTPMLIRQTSNFTHEKDHLRRTNWKSEQKSQPETDSPGFLGKYLSLNGLRSGSLQDVFDVLRLENPDFRIIDNKIRTLLCLIKTLVVRAVMIENGNKHKDPEIGESVNPSQAQLRFPKTMYRRHRRNQVAFWT